ncbi:hypothetical protein FK268_09925 [Tsukamurella sputi]|uniref:RNA polymerase sigma-70 region 4 domain-containing protein n=2 Tax=Tsukamurella sputi TaxID=2591848 RepID=A0A5C5RN02_9ACTN|nr:hypothetical protein FK268_09925 [Tsukamurella sputi]
MKFASEFGGPGNGLGPRIFHRTSSDHVSVSVPFNVPRSGELRSAHPPNGGCARANACLAFAIMEVRPRAADARLRAALPPELYRVLHLRVIERRTIEETAGLLRITPDAVRLRQHRAMERIRRDLRARGR